MKIRVIIAKCILPATLLVLALCRPLPAFAATTVAISTVGNGVFAVRGTGIEGAAALELVVSYNMAALANPRVSAGPLIAGAMTAINTNVPGIVRMIMIRLTPVTGSGVIATLTFDCNGASPGKILSFSAKIANPQGAPLPALVQVNNPTDAAAADADLPQSQEPTTGTMQTAPIFAPTIILAGQPDKHGEAGTVPDMQGTEEPGDQPVPSEPGDDLREKTAIMARKTENAPMSGDVAPAAPAQLSTIIMHKSVLDRFQDRKGAATPEAFVALFGQDSTLWWRQDPPVALSDGMTVVRVTFISTPGDKTLSDIAVEGAKLISLKKHPDKTNTWIVELLPEHGTYRASLLVFQGDAKMVYPLTVAPKAASGRSPSGTVTKEEFTSYFTEKRPASSKGTDANNDGKSDYLDDYIVTANYLAAARPALSQGRFQ